MKKLSRNVLFMALALSLSLAACGKEKPEDKKPADQKEQTQKNPQDKDKDKDTSDGQSDAQSDAPSDDPSQKEPQVGDQCSYATFETRCHGKDVLRCFHTDYDVPNSPYVITIDECDGGESCTAVTYNGKTHHYCILSEDLYDSCSEAINAYYADMEEEDAPVCTQLSAEDLLDYYGITNNVTTYYSLESELLCLNAGDNQKLVYPIDHLCTSCSVDFANKSTSCEQVAALTGATASENDDCYHLYFVPRRLDSKNALVCDYDTKKVKKVTCSGNLEIALTTELDEFLEDINDVGVVCVNTQEKECKADLFKCGTHEGAAASFLHKGCFTTDKGRHLVSKEDAPDWEGVFEDPMVCGAKGCNQATGMCNK